MVTRIKTKSIKINRARISIGIIVPLLIGIFLIFSGSLAANTFQDDKELKALEEEASNLAAAIKGQPIMPSVSKDRLREAQEKQEKATNFFPAELKGSTSLQAILTIATQSDVQVTNIQEKPPARQIVGENVFYSWPFSLKVEGTLWSLLTLISRLERYEAGPLVLQKVALEKNKANYSSSLELMFYSRSRTEFAPKLQKPERGKK
ncbi:MAG: hypothetical protein HW384_136 [Dehalococcoidia bacterium]|nr:hypothetical protein [Dehalococcoidia bacterium]